MTYKIVLKRNGREIDSDTYWLGGSNPDKHAKSKATKFIQGNLGMDALRGRNFGKWKVADYGMVRISRGGAYTVHMAKYDDNGDRVSGKDWQ